MEERIVVHQVVQSDSVQEIQSELEDITKSALAYARQVMQTGTSEQKTALTRTILSGAMKVVGSDAAEIEHEAKQAIESIFAEQRQISAKPHAITATTYDPDEIPHD